MPIRVLMIGAYPFSPRHIDGGVAAATMYLSQALAKRPEIELIGVRVANSGSTKSASDELGWQVDNLELGRLSVSTCFLRPRQRLELLLRRYRPHIVHGQGADVSGYLAVRSGYPAVVTIHGILNECAKFRTNLVSRLREQAQARITERFVVTRARHIIAISPYVSRYYASYLRDSVYEIPNAVAPAFFELQQRSERGRILFAGRISQGKGILDLVQVVALEPRAARKIILAGTAPEKRFASRLQTAIVEAGVVDRIVMPGLLDESALLTEFSRAAALVLPSYQETAPMVVQQAMAAGLPVVATRVGGIPNLIEHEVSGLLFEPGDIGELGRLLRRLDGDFHLGQRLAAGAKAIAASRFTADTVAVATLAAYQEVLRVA